MNIYRCPHCRQGVRISANVIKEHRVVEPIKTWIRRDDLDDTIMVDVYPLCPWSNAQAKFPNGVPPRAAAGGKP